MIKISDFIYQEMIFPLYEISWNKCVKLIDIKCRRFNYIDGYNYNHRSINNIKHTKYIDEYTNKSKVKAISIHNLSTHQVRKISSYDNKLHSVAIPNGFRLGGCNKYFIKRGELLWKKNA